jgi:hypothetical protein
VDQRGTGQHLAATSRGRVEQALRNVIEHAQPPRPLVNGCAAALMLEIRSEHALEVAPAMFDEAALPGRSGAPRPDALLDDPDPALDLAAVHALLAQSLARHRQQLAEQQRAHRVQPPIQPRDVRVEPPRVAA